MTEEERMKRDDEEQSARFIKDAERVQEEGAEERFEEAIKNIAKKTHQKLKQVNKISTSS